MSGNPFVRSSRRGDTAPRALGPAELDEAVATVDDDAVSRVVDPVSVDAMRVDASGPEGEAWLAEWRAVLKSAKGRR